jgi:hypothetical protein
MSLAQHGSSRFNIQVDLAVIFRFAGVAKDGSPVFSFSEAYSSPSPDMMTFQSPLLILG